MQIWSYWSRSKKATSASITHHPSIIAFKQTEAEQQEKDAEPTRAQKHHQEHVASANYE